MAILSRNSSIFETATERKNEEEVYRKMKEMSQEQDIERRLNQDFVAPAPYHMPIEVVSARVREHQH